MVLLVVTIGIATGSACALFLAALETVTRLRFEQPWLLWLLPLAGAVVGGIDSRYGQGVEAGNRLLVEQIDSPTEGVPPKLGPLILLTTLLTHFCGGSAGREGTALQMGGAIAGGLSRFVVRLSRLELRILTMAGVAAGFGGVFGTPIAGTVFALELAVLGRMELRAIVPCLVATFISDQTCTAWGIDHTHYVVASLIPEGSPTRFAPWSGKLIASAVMSGVGFGLASRLFVAAVGASQVGFRRLSSSPVIRPTIGGCAVIALTLLLGTRDYLGIGVTSPDTDGVSLTAAFHPGDINPLSWFWKLLLTAITLGSGFKGGEATPLFFIGATLGHTLAVATGCPVDLWASLGFVAVFIAATKTPVAGIVMSVELFGGETVMYHAIVCTIAWACSGRHGIFTRPNPATLIETGKGTLHGGKANTVGDFSEVAEST